MGGACCGNNTIKEGGVSLEQYDSQECITEKNPNKNLNSTRAILDVSS